MDKLQKTLGIGALVLSLIGCSNSDASQGIYQPLSGKPISVAENDLTLSTVIEVDSKKILAIGYSGITGRVSEGVALIQSEISDGDNEQILLIGKYNNEGRFEIDSLKANGYQVDFR